MRREEIEQAGASQTEADLLGRAARCHAFGKPDRGDCLVDKRNRSELARIALQHGLLHLRLKIFGKTAAHLVFDRQAGFAIGYAEEAFQYLFRRDRIAVPAQDVGMRAARNDLAVDQHAVAIEDDEIENRIFPLARFLHASRFPLRSKTRRLQVLSSSSGTQ